MWLNNGGGGTCTNLSGCMWFVARLSVSFGGMRGANSASLGCLLG